MQYTTKYETPLGSVLLAADETGLTGLWFDGAGYYAAGLAARHEEKEVPRRCGRGWISTSPGSSRSACRRSI